MADLLDTLTTREKAALRLLLEGHDAKSAASLLKISVHTVNDRLRRARQKLGVTSSREAARILGVHEGKDPQNHVHEEIGIAQQPDTDNNPDIPGQQHTLRKTRVLIAGVVFVTIIAATLFAFAALSPSQDGATQTEASAMQADPEATLAATSWIALIDQNKAAESWQRAGDAFKSQVTAEQWADALAAVRGPLGVAGDRVVASEERTSTLPGAPEGDYQVVMFATEFAKGGSRAETIVMVNEGGNWRTVGYFVR